MKILFEPSHQIEMKLEKSSIYFLFLLGTFVIPSKSGKVQNVLLLVGNVFSFFFFLKFRKYVIVL